MAKPTFVLVPGSFCVANIYAPFIAKLRAKGFPALEITLPSTQKRVGLEPATMQEDAKQVRAIAEALVSQGKEVVVVCHSYGGMPTAEALVGVGVKRIVYLAAIAPKVGETMADAMAGPMIQGMLRSTVNGYMHADPVQLAYACGNDLDSWEDAYEFAKQLPHHSTASFQEKLTQAAYAEVPVSYIFTEKDLIVSPEQQENFVKNIEEAKGEKIDVIRKPWGHCPNWSFPEELLEIFAAVAEK
ncbi:alpha/beta-hydrolase [Bimuria novae-zelandiae CBS 107.79]|uniref:Alpha/beta-hydrolase n=1 Tax=Bimuria novae-zelandiae CBS 107.79 TaxID=1447943 RepID=A0A6A5UIY6_9PLEO|nr:alpha/beta-hydrolase [Bimuria novae-zelandiae CBS 107.79]